MTEETKLPKSDTRAPEVGYHALFADVLREVERAMTKFPTWPTDPLHALAVLGEEYGELTKEVLQMTYEPHKSSLDAVRTEAVQTAAMALRFLASLGTYEYRAGVQHAQSANVSDQRTEAAANSTEATDTTNEN